MFNHETINPIRILNAVKRFIINLGERGEVDLVPDPNVTPPPTFIFPPELVNHPIVTKYKGDPTEIAKALIEVQDLIGPEKIILPSKDANEEEWNKRVWNRLGRPEKPELYALPTDLKIPPELPVDEKMITNFKTAAHKYGLLPHQVAGMYKWFMEEQIAGFENMKTIGTTARNEAETKLRREWGAAFPQNVALGEKVLNSFGDAGIIAFLKTNGLNNDPAFIKFLAKIGEAFSEDQLIGKPKGLTMTPEEAQAEIKKITGDKNHPYWIENHAEHKAAVEKMLALYAMVHPE
jgi:hypothetical protein